MKYKLILCYAKILSTGKVPEMSEKLNNICEQIKTETSSKVLSGWLQAAEIVCGSVQVDRNQTGQLLEAGKHSLLNSANPQVII